MAKSILGQTRMCCPRCNLELRRAEMIDHLWREHRLVLDGRHVREPWSVLQGWLEESRDLSASLRERCETLAQQADPDQGLTRLSRLVLQRGIKDNSSLKRLLKAAKETGASVCPSCFAYVPIPSVSPGRPLNLYRGRLSGAGYRVEIVERGLLTSLQLQSPSGFCIHQREPGALLTLRAWLWLTAGPLLLLALLIALGMSPWRGDPFWPVLLLLGAALSAGIWIAIKKGPATPLADRVVDRAWSVMLPQLVQLGVRPADVGFLGSLALVSIERGSRAVRRPFFETALRFAVAEAVAGRAIAPLAALRRLIVHDTVAEGHDPVPLVLEELVHCLLGRLPLAYGEALLTDWETGWWTPGNLTRLRVLLCERAFEAGFEVAELMEIGLSHAALGSVLAITRPLDTAHLHYLWSLRTAKPWDQIAPCTTVFEVARDREAATLLQLFPDLLLYHADPAMLVTPLPHGTQPGPLRIVLCGRGVALQEVLFERPPASFHVSSHWFSGGYEMRISSEAFRCSAEPSGVKDRLDRWCHWLFQDFLPQSSAAALSGKQSSDAGAKLRARGAVPCPECRRAVLPRVGALAREPAG